MKKKLTPFIATLILFAATSFAGNADLFTYDRSEVEANLQELITLENYILVTEITLQELTITNSELADLIYDHSGYCSLSNPEFDFEDMDWGSFAWGLCCWPVGVFTVLLNDDKGNDSRISYFIGLGTSVIISITGASANPFGWRN